MPFVHSHLPSMLMLLLAALGLPPAATSGEETTGAAGWSSATSCPKPCKCYVQPSELLSPRTVLLKTANCSYESLKTLKTLGFGRNTEALLLVGNQLRDEFVPDLLQLRELDLSTNQIRSLGSGYAFVKLASLTYLNLAKNELTSVVRDVFFGLTSLRMLVLADNKLGFVEDQAFHGLPSLLVLDLSRNRLTSLYPEWFHGLVRLEELYVYENRVHAVGSATFRPLPRLQHLSLHGNRIGHVSDDGFWGLDVLSTLHLERNNLKRIPVRAVQQLASLKHLYANGNPLERIRRGDASDLAAVEELELNSLSSLVLVDAFGFSNLPRLHSLQLKDCARLAYIDSEAFVNLPALRALVLRNNRLLTLPSQIARALPVGVQVELGGNKFRCDCNVRWMEQEVRLAGANASRVRFVDVEDIVCDAPDNVQGTSLADIFKASAAASTMPANCPPSILPTLDKAIERLVGESLVLDCRSIGVPSPQLRWVLPDGRNASPSTASTRLGATGLGTIEFRHVQEEDRGAYVCAAENAMGATSMTVTLTVKRIDIHLFATVVSSTFITVVWNGTARKDFSRVRILYRPLSSSGQLPTPSSNNHSSNNNNDSSSSSSSASYREVTARASRFDLTISNLEPDSAYELCIAHEDTGPYYVMLSCAVATTRNAAYMLQGIDRTDVTDVLKFLAVLGLVAVGVCFSALAARKYRQRRQYVCPGEHVVYNVSHIPLKNMYSPLMSSVGP